MGGGKKASNGVAEGCEEELAGGRKALGGRLHKHGKGIYSH